MVKIEWDLKDGLNQEEDAEPRNRDRQCSGETNLDNLESGNYAGDADGNGGDDGDDNNDEDDNDGVRVDDEVAGAMREVGERGCLHQRHGRPPRRSGEDDGDDSEDGHVGDDDGDD